MTGRLPGTGIAAVLAVALATTAVHAQDATRAPFDPQRPLIVRLPAEPPPLASKPVTPLDAVQTALLLEAKRARDAGRFDDARRKLDALSAVTQHHPFVLTERARLENAAGRFAEVTRLAVFERRAQRDSLLLAPELEQAWESLQRWRDASATVVEAWAASPAMEPWAMETLLRLADHDGRAGRDGLRRATARAPLRQDMIRGMAALEYRAGDMRAALQALRAIEPIERGPRDRWAFAERLLQSRSDADSTGAAETYLDIAGDTRLEVAYRMTAARRANDLADARGLSAATAPKLYAALRDVPSDQWMPDLSLALARTLRQSGDTGAARALLGTGKKGDGARPELSLERALADLRDGPPERALEALQPTDHSSDEQRFYYAEALFFSGMPDSAAVWYQKVSENPGGPYTGAALERLFLIEDGQPRSGVTAFGRIAYEQWRSAPKRALTLAESLLVDLPRGPLWAQTALLAATEKERAGDARGALALALAVADSLPEDRLAPLARQRAGDLYSFRLKDDASAIEQYEACVARYPRAWNAAEVRRRLEELRRTRRF